VHSGVSCVGAMRNCLEAPYHSDLNCFCHDRHTTRPTATIRRRAPLTTAAQAPTPRTSRSQRAKAAPRRPDRTLEPRRDRLRQTVRRGPPAQSTQRQSMRRPSTLRQSIPKTVIDTPSTRRRSMRRRSTRLRNILPSSRPQRDTRQPSTRMSSRPARVPQSCPQRSRRVASAPDGAGAVAAEDRRLRTSSPRHPRVATRTSRHGSGCSRSMGLFARTAAGASRRA
jgi:hypothetical protein